VGDRSVAESRTDVELRGNRVGQRRARAECPERCAGLRRGPAAGRITGAPRRRAGVRRTLTVWFILSFLPFGGLVGQPAVPRWSLVPDLRLESDPAGAYVFTDVMDIAESPGGDVYVADAMERAVRVFDRAATFLRNLGRKGQGPGEFMMLERLGWIGDTLWVYDPALRRISRFSASGAFIGSISLQAQLEDRTPVEPYALLADGSALGMTSSRVRPETVTLFRVDPSDGRILNTVAQAWWGDATMVVRPSPDAVGGYHTPQPFGDYDLFLPARAGSMVVVVQRRAAREASGGE